MIGSRPTQRRPYDRCRSVAFMRGIINLRGSDRSRDRPRLKFALPSAVTTVHTCIVITEVEVAGGNVVIGVMADDSPTGARRILAYRRRPRAETTKALGTMPRAFVFAPSFSPKHAAPAGSVPGELDEANNGLFVVQDHALHADS